MSLVKKRLKYHISLINPVQVNKTISISPKSNYIFHEESVNEIIELDDLDKTINHYITIISNHKYKRRVWNVCSIYQDIFSQIKEDGPE